MTEQQFNVMHGFFLSLTAMMTAESQDRRKFEKEANAAAALLDDHGIPFGLQNLIAAAAADGEYFPIRLNRMQAVKEALGAVGHRKTIECKRAAVLSVLGDAVSPAEVMAAEL